MTGNGETNREVQLLRERNSALCGAILRIGSSLDQATVLQEIVDSARALTGARYGIIVTIDETARSGSSPSPPGSAPRTNASSWSGRRARACSRKCVAGGGRCGPKTCRTTSTRATPPRR